MERCNALLTGKQQEHCFPNGNDFDARVCYPAGCIRQLLSILQQLYSIPSEIRETITYILCYAQSTTTINTARASVISRSSFNSSMKVRCGSLEFGASSRSIQRNQRSKRRCTIPKIRSVHPPYRRIESSLGRADYSIHINQLPKN